MAVLTAPEMQPRHMIALVELVTDSVISTPNLIPCYFSSQLHLGYLGCMEDVRFSIWGSGQE